MNVIEACPHCSKRGLCPGCKQPVFSMEDVEKMDGSGRVYCEQCGWTDDEQYGILDEWDCCGACHRD